MRKDRGLVIAAAVLLAFAVASQLLVEALTSELETWGENSGMVQLLQVMCGEPVQALRLLVSFSEMMQRKALLMHLGVTWLILLLLYNKSNSRGRSPERSAPQSKGNSGAREYECNDER